MYLGAEAGPFSPFVLTRCLAAPLHLMTSKNLIKVQVTCLSERL